MEKDNTTLLRIKKSWMILCLFSGIVLSLIVFAFTYKLASLYGHNLAKNQDFYTFYADNFRGPFFSGFLTLSSFLLAAHTFIVGNLKKEVYERDGYQHKIQEARVDRPSVTFFGPLKRVSSTLLTTIIFALWASISQITIGVLARNQIGACLCIAFGFVAILFVIGTLILLILVMQDWFEYIEQDAVGKHSTR